MQIKEFLYFIENKFPKYRFSYENATYEASSVLYEDNYDIMERERQIIEKYRPERGESEILTNEKLKQIFKENISTDIFNLKDKLDKNDLINALNFRSDYIPLLKNDIYYGVVEKNHFVQLLLTYFIQESVSTT